MLAILIFIHFLMNIEFMRLALHSHLNVSLEDLFEHSVWHCFEIEIGYIILVYIVLPRSSPVAEEVRKKKKAFIGSS